MNGARLEALADRSSVRRLVLVAAGLAMLLLLGFIGRWLTFWYDEWNFLLDRPDPTLETILTPHVGHLVAIPVLIYEGLLRVFGMGSYWPWLAVLWACHLASVVLLYRIVERLAGPWIGCLAALSLLTLGSAFEDLLQAFQMAFLLSTAFGLLAIERLGARPDGRAVNVLIACLALLVAVASSSLGVIFLGVVLVWGLLGRHRDQLVAAVPVAVVYAIWYVAWGRDPTGAAGAISAEPLQPLWAFSYGLGAAVASVIGLPPSRYAPVGLLIGLLVAARLVVTGFRPTTFGIAALTGFLAIYALQAVLRAGLGLEHAARSGYLYPAAILLWLALADVLASRGPLTVPWGLRVVIVCALVLAIAGNLTQLIGAGRAMHDLRATMVAELRMIESMRNVAGLALDESPDPELIPQVTPRRYLKAVDRFGRPRLAIESQGEDPLDLADPAHLNAAAVSLLENAFSRGGTVASPPPAGLVVTQGNAHPDGPACVAISGSGSLVASWQVMPGEGFSVAPGEAAQASPVSLRFGVRPGLLAAAPPSLTAVVGDGTVLIPPPLPDGGPWFIEAEGPGPFTICRGVSP